MEKEKVYEKCLKMATSCDRLEHIEICCRYFLLFIKNYNPPDIWIAEFKFHLHHQKIKIRKNEMRKT